MDEEIDFAERFERFDEEYLKFERIPQDARYCDDRELCGLMKLYSLRKNKLSHVIGGAGHDEIYLSAPEECVELSDEELVYLQRCGICWDSNGYFCLHV